MSKPDGNDKPALLRAIEVILADPKTIKAAATSLYEEYKRRYAEDRPAEDIADLVADKVISNYSYYAAFAGGATALTGVVPGLGTVIATFGGATADIALTMKYQLEMTMAVATVYGHDITEEEEKTLCFLVAGLGAIAEAGKTGAKATSTKAFINDRKRGHSQFLSQCGLRMKKQRGHSELLSLTFASDRRDTRR